MRLAADWLAMTLLLASCTTSEHVATLSPPKETPHPPPVFIPPPTPKPLPTITDAAAQQTIADGTRIVNHSETATQAQKDAISTAMAAAYPALVTLHDCAPEMIALYPDLGTDCVKAGREAVGPIDAVNLTIEAAK